MISPEKELTAEKEHCVVSYDIQVEKEVFKYINNDWVRTTVSEKPVQYVASDNSRIIESIKKAGINVITGGPSPKLSIDKNCDNSKEQIFFIQN